MVGAQVRIDYASEAWDGLTKTVVFSGAVTKDITTDDTIVDIPAECMAMAGVLLKVGVFGFRAADRKVVIPTVEANIGRLLRGTDPSGDESTNPALPVWAEILETAKRAESISGTSAQEALIAAERALSAKDAASASELYAAQAAKSAEDSAAAASGAAASADQAKESAAQSADAAKTAVEGMQNDLSNVKDDLAAVDSAKLTAPESGMEVGKYFRIASIGEDGKAVLEAVDLPLATKYGEAGLFCALKDYGGFGFVNGEPRIKGADRATISNRGASYMPICADMRMDYAVKCAMTDGKGEVWTADEQQSSRERMGIHALTQSEYDSLTDTSGIYIIVEG